MIKFSVTQWHHFSAKMIMNTGKGVTTARCSLKYMHLPEITENKTSVWIRGLSMFLISKSWSTSNNQSCSVLSSPKSHTHFQTAHLIKLCGYRLDEWETIFNSCQDQIIFFFCRMTRPHPCTLYKYEDIPLPSSPSRLWWCAPSQTFTIHKDISLAHISDDYPYLKSFFAHFHVHFR